MRKMRITYMKRSYETNILKLEFSPSKTRAQLKKIKSDHKKELETLIENSEKKIKTLELCYHSLLTGVKKN